LNFQQSFLCDIDTIKTYKTKIKKVGIKTNHIAPLSLMPFDDSPNRQRLRAEIYINRLYPEKSIELNLKDYNTLKDIEPRVNTKKIRLGYVSADFNSHAVSYLISGLIETHNRDNFEVFGYSLNSKDTDEMNHRMRKAFDKYIECDDLSDKEVALRIKSEEIDILVDLNGHTLGSRTGIFAFRPSKIQINFLGFPGTMGASYIDYIISDYTVIPDKFKEFYNEKIIRLPHTYMPTDNKRIIADKLITRKEMGLPQKGIIFCCFNNSYKISHIEFDIWMRILSKIKDSILWLKIDNNDTARENLRNAALKRGVDPSRIIFAEYLSMDEHLARYALADIFLDTFNFNAHTTACDTLWAGTPIVTKLGKSFVSRVAGSLLTAIDIPELITNSELEYENLILKLASSPDNLKKIKQKLHENLSTKPLFDTKRYTHYLETAFIKAFTNHSSGNKPIDIDISQ
jgi:predicted O-linked N-acetylglucosamine transferase (SPINDLY family)